MIAIPESTATVTGATAPIGTGETSHVFSCLSNYLLLHFTGTFSSEAFALEVSVNGVNGWEPFMVKDEVGTLVAQEFTEPSTHAYLAHGLHFRLVGDGAGSGSTSVGIHAGPNVHIKP